MPNKTLSPLRSEEARQRRRLKLARLKCGLGFRVSGLLLFIQPPLHVTPPAWVLTVHDQHCVQTKSRDILTTALWTTTNYISPSICCRASSRPGSASSATAAAAPAAPDAALAVCTATEAGSGWRQPTQRSRRDIISARSHGPRTARAAARSRKERRQPHCEAGGAAGGTVGQVRRGAAAAGGCRHARLLLPAQDREGAGRLGFRSWTDLVRHDM